MAEGLNTASERKEPSVCFLLPMTSANKLNRFFIGKTVSMNFYFLAVL